MSLLKAEPELTAITLLEHLEEQYPTLYDQRVLRTLQRRVKQWKALHGPDKEVTFRQQAEPGRQGFSDFTHPESLITIKQEPFEHLLYQFRFAFSGWRSVTVVQGGESYSALATGIQSALSQAGGSPIEHRTDSLSAARNNRQNQWTDAYNDLCDHYNVLFSHFRHEAMRNFNKYLDGNAVMVPFADEEYGLCKHHGAAGDKK
ncbi:hypothetical protein V9N52_004331 [Vibrio navarrensis]